MPVSYMTERPQGRGLSYCWVLSRKCVKSKNSPSLETVNGKWIFSWGTLSTAHMMAVREGQQAPGLEAVMPREQEGSCQGPREVECCLRPGWALVTSEWSLAGRGAGALVQPMPLGNLHLFAKLRRIHKVKSSM